MIIDISWPLKNGMTEYKNRSTVQISAYKTIEQDGVSESLVTFHTHSGTHIDAPTHFIKDGKTIDQISLESCIGPCSVLDFMHIEEKITAADFKAYDIQPGARILCKTRNSLRALDEPFNATFVYLDASAAAYLVERSIALIGIDYLGIERNQIGHPTHRELLSHNIVVLEGICLGLVAAGNYRLICLPLAIPGMDAAPARALLHIL